MQVQLIATDAGDQQIQMTVGVEITRDQEIRICRGGAHPSRRHKLGNSHMFDCPFRFCCGRIWKYRIYVPTVNSQDTATRSRHEHSEIRHPVLVEIALRQCASGPTVGELPHDLCLADVLGRHNLPMFKTMFDLAGRSSSHHQHECAHSENTTVR